MSKARVKKCIGGRPLEYYDWLTKCIDKVWVRARREKLRSNRKDRKKRKIVFLYCYKAKMRLHIYSKATTKKLQIFHDDLPF